MVRSSIFSILLNYCTFGLTLLVSFLSVKMYLIDYGLEYAGKINILIMVKGLMELSSGFITSKQVQLMMIEKNKAAPFKAALNFAILINMIIFPIIVISLSLLLNLFGEVIWFALYAYVLQIFTVYIGRMNAELNILTTNFIKFVAVLPASMYVVFCYNLDLRISFSSFVMVNIISILAVMLPLVARYKNDTINFLDPNLQKMKEIILNSKTYLWNSVLSMALPLIEVSIITTIFGFDTAALYTILLKLPNAIGVIAQKSIDPLAPFFAKAQYVGLGEHLRNVLISGSLIIFIIVSLFGDDMYQFWLGDEMVNLSGEYNIFFALSAVGAFVSKTKTTALFYTKSIITINRLLSFEFLIRMSTLYFSYQYFGIYSMYGYVLITYLFWLRLR